MFSLCSLEVDRSESKGTTNSTSAYLDMSNHRDTADSFDSKPFLILMREPLTLMLFLLCVLCGSLVKKTGKTHCMLRYDTNTMTVYYDITLAESNEKGEQRESYENDERSNPKTLCMTRKNVMF